MSKRRHFRHESYEDAESIAAYLDALKDAFAAGTLRLSQDEDGQVVLEPSGLIRFEVEASPRRERSRLVLRFEWSNRAAPEGDDPLIISAEPRDKP